MKRAVMKTIALPAMVLSGLMASAAIGASDPLDRDIRTLMRDQDVKGLAVAVIEAGLVARVSVYGDRNVQRQQPLEADTIMYGASLTKAAFAYMLMQLVDEGRLDLDRPIGDYLAKPLPAYERWRSLAEDPAWRRLTPRILMSHTSGLANLRFLEPNRDLRFHFEPGTAYAYSGEGFWILQTLLEQGLGLDVKTEMQQRLFTPLMMSNTDMQWREDFAANLADGYAFDGSFEPHDARSHVSASGSMDTTIADQAKLWAAFVRGDGLSDAARKAWVAGQFPIRTRQKFPTVEMHATDDPRGVAISFSAGLGVETWVGPQGRAFAKAGHNDWTANLVICLERGERCVVMLSNSVRAELIFPALAEKILGETGYPWWWAYPSLHGGR